MILRRAGPGLGPRSVVRLASGVGVRVLISVTNWGRVVGRCGGRLASSLGLSAFGTGLRALVAFLSLLLLWVAVGHLGLLLGRGHECRVYP